MSFKSLSLDELKRTAVEDFAVDFEEGATKDSVIAALAESGVTWQMYCQAVGLEEEVEKPLDKASVKRSEVKTVEAGVSGDEEDKYLIRMDRENPYFEFRGYKFTKENPYAVMPVRVANAILTLEDGFAVASPAEVAEFYDRV